jgi:hypothetical protein
MLLKLGECKLVRFMAAETLIYVDMAKDESFRVVKEDINLQSDIA